MLCSPPGNMGRISKRKITCFPTIRLKKMLQRLKKISQCNIFTPFCIIIACQKAIFRKIPYSIS